LLPWQLRIFPTSGKIEFSLRRENLSFSHHKAVARLLPDNPERADELLSLAETNHWSTRRLREEVGAPATAPKNGSGGGSDHTHRAQGTGEKWGDKYEAVIEATGLSYQGVADTKYPRRSPIFRAREKLSFEVAALSPERAANCFLWVHAPPSGHGEVGLRDGREVQV
jgi:hypothetical protein